MHGMAAVPLVDSTGCFAPAVRTAAGPPGPPGKLGYVLFVFLTSLHTASDKYFCTTHHW